ncbi:SMI1/KNR4 family protein [Planococcus alpniumensis]|uniref:SMI1/KNR4 family protein n=1 Tax=Planococcus alpniumensis TaxID=2708345 RepID=UPI001B8BFF4B|nr:SMI1/KNR4 family protein [Planococcus sp. MSAK28401]
MKKHYYTGKNFWRYDTNDSRPLYPCNNEIIEKAELVLGIRFPNSFKDLMKKRNGGELHYPYFTVPATRANSRSGEVFHLPCIEPIHFEVDNTCILSSKELITSTNDERGGKALSDKLIVLWTDFHHWLVFDYKNQKETPSVLLIVENYDSPEIVWEIIELAESFDQFLEQLFLETN